MSLMFAGYVFGQWHVSKTCKQNCDTKIKSAITTLFVGDSFLSISHSWISCHLYFVNSKDLSADNGAKFVQPKTFQNVLMFVDCWCRCSAIGSCVMQVV